MSFLIDTDTCSAYLKGDRRVFNRFLQYTGALHISLITVAELHVWALRLNAPANRIQDLNGLLQQGILLQVTRNVAYKYGEVQAGLMDAGTPAPQMDLLIAATALVHGLTLVTHNVAHYVNVPGLNVVDWLVP